MPIFSKKCNFNISPYVLLLHDGKTQELAQRYPKAHPKEKGESQTQETRLTSLVFVS